MFAHGVPVWVTGPVHVELGSGSGPAPERAVNAVVGATAFFFFARPSPSGARGGAEHDGQGRSRAPVESRCNAKPWAGKQKAGSDPGLSCCWRKKTHVPSWLPTGRARCCVRALMSRKSGWRPGGDNEKETAGGVVLGRFWVSSPWRPPGRLALRGHIASRPSRW